MRSSTPDAPPSELELIERELVEREAARRHLRDFCARVDEHYETARHTELLCEILELVERGEIPRLIIQLPPRHSKTHHVDRFAAWYMGHHPAHQYVQASYSQDLAELSSQQVRNLLADPSRSPFAVGIDPGMSALGRWRTTAGGLFTAVGVGGSLTGKGAHVLSVDDPIKDRKEADSPTMREHIWSWFQEVARTRLMPGGRIIVTMTRWHEDDLVGRILNSPGASDWFVLRLPAICEDDTLPTERILGRHNGDALWPEWFPVDALPSVAKGEISQRGWNALYQQRPSAEAGNLFLRSYHRFYNPEALRVAGVLAGFTSVDSAFKDGVANDFSVAGTWSAHRGQAYLRDVWRERVQFPELIAGLRGVYGKWRAPLVIEDKASGISAIQMLSRPTRDHPAIPTIAWKPPRYASKVARAEAVSPYFEGGLVYVPNPEAPGCGWVADYIDELASFPNGEHDDQVDMTSMALARIYLQGREERAAQPLRRGERNGEATSRFLAQRATERAQQFDQLVERMEAAEAVRLDGRR